MSKQPKKNSKPKFSKSLQKTLPRGGISSNVPYPQEYSAEMHYTTPLTISGTSISGYVFRANSLYDPDFTGTGGQPYMFDQLATIYNRYRVFSVKFKLDIVNTTIDFPVFFGYSADNVSGAFTTMTAAATAPFSKYSILSAFPAPTSHRTFSGKFNIAKVLGYTMNIDDDLSSLVTTNPAQVLFMHLTADTIPSAENFSLQCFIHLKYSCKFYDLKQVNESITRIQLAPKQEENKEDEDADSFTSKILEIGNKLKNKKNKKA